MKYTLLICFIFLVSVTQGQNPPSEEFSMSADSFLVAMDKKNNEFVGKPYPQFSVGTRDRERTNQQLKGKVVFINFWFAACAPCMAEMDALNELFKNFKQNKNFAFLSLTFDDPHTVEIIKKKYKIGYPVFSVSRDECYRLNNNNGFPTSILLGKAGSVQWIHSTGQLDKAEIKKYFVTTVYPEIQKELRR